LNESLQHREELSAKRSTRGLYLYTENPNGETMTSTCPICEGVDNHDGLVRALNPDQITPPSSAKPSPGWIAVKFEQRVEQFDVELMDRLMKFEFLAANVISAAGVGMPDGNEIGAHSYDLFWDGPDVDTLWRVIEALLPVAPATWTTAEIHRRTTSVSRTAMP
jgi:hypothetical protein